MIALQLIRVKGRILVRQENVTKQKSSVRLRVPRENMVAALMESYHATRVH